MAHFEDIFLLYEYSFLFHFVALDKLDVYSGLAEEEYF